MIKIGELKINNALVQELNLKISGKNGVLNLDPITLKTYQGDVSAKTTLDVRQNIPKSNITLLAKGIQVGPLLKDVAGLGHLFRQRNMKNRKTELVILIRPILVEDDTWNTYLKSSRDRVRGMGIGGN